MLQSNKKKIFSLSAIFLLAAGFCSGVYVQQRHFLTPLKRFMWGYAAKVTPPETTILDWDYSGEGSPPPRYDFETISFSEIETHRPEYLKKLAELLKLGAFPTPFPLHAERIESVELSDGLIREKIRLETEPGLWIPFYLFIPPGDLPKPAILVLHGHSAGKVETTGLRNSYQKGNALVLARAGFITVAPDFRGFGELGWEGDWDDAAGHAIGKNVHRQDAKHLLKIGRTLLGAYIYDSRKILDFMATRPEIDAGHIGVAGSSMGAEVAIYLTILDQRIKAVVASAPSFSNTKSPKRFKSSHICIDVIPGFELVFSYHQIPALLAPRPLLIDTNQKDITEKQSFERIYREAGFTDHLSFYSHSEGETFHNDKAIEWFRQWL